MTIPHTSKEPAFVRISPISIIVANWILSIINKPDYIIQTESSIRYQHRGKLTAYTETQLQMPAQTSYQIRGLYSSLEKVAMGILMLGLKQKNAQRPEYMLPQLQLAIEPHYDELAGIYSHELLCKIY
ncbi:hypothetical protein [Vibrio sp. PNB22_8_1]|uniref:hypothetical protein n=1 Tax=unclassified Vibrio TaxID=2614977 RepID=UPI00406A1196